MRNRFWTSFACAGAIVAMAGSAATSYANTTREYGPLGCATSSGARALGANATAEGLPGTVYYCPILNGTDFPVTSTSTINVAGYMSGPATGCTGVTNTTVQACVTYIDVAAGGSPGGGACGTTSTYSTLDSNFAISPDLSKWSVMGSATPEPVYVVVTLGGVAQSNCQHESLIYGIKITY